MFEEVCLYLMDGRLENAIVGVCWCIRANFDLIQLWTKNNSSHATVEVFIGKLQLLLGTRADIPYQRIADVYGSKTSKARKFYLIESVPAHHEGVAMFVDGVVQMREFGNKKKDKKSADEFTEVAGSTKKDTKKSETQARSPLLSAQDQSVAVENNYGLLEGDEDTKGDGVIGENIQLFEKKKTDKSRKNSSKKGSTKSKKTNKNEFDSLLTGNSAPLIPQQVFVGAG